MRDPFRDSLDRARKLVDKVEDVETYKATNALLGVLEVLYMEAMGALQAPQQMGMPAMLSAEDLAKVIEKNRKAKETADEDEPVVSEKAQERLDEIRKNQYL